MVYVRFEYGQEDRISPEYGPYLWVQITYDEIRAAETKDYEVTLAHMDQHGMWCRRNKSYSDVIIFTE